MLFHRQEGGHTQKSNSDTIRSNQAGRPHCGHPAPRTTPDTFLLPPTCRTPGLDFVFVLALPVGETKLTVETLRCVERQGRYRQYMLVNSEVG